MYESLEFEYIEKLPEGKDSTKGIGRVQPDPAAFKMLEGKIEVPLGKPTKDYTKHLDYNEYIVYDDAQFNIRYMLQMNIRNKWRNYPHLLFISIKT